MGVHTFTSAEQERMSDYDKKKKKMLSSAAKYSFLFGAIVLALLLVIGTGLFIGMNERLHNNIITRLEIEIESEFAKEQNDPYVINAHIMQYFRSKEDLIQVNYFELNEKTHLRDVKNLINTGKLISLSLLIIVIILVLKSYVIYRMIGKDMKEWSINSVKTIQVASIIAIVLWILLFLIYVPVSTQAFDGAFVRMHEQLFPQGNWQFPESSLLIRTYPLEFFHSLGLSIVRYSLLLITLILLLSTVVLMMLKGQINIYPKRQ
jgi:uncharacterized membrane protein